MRSSPNRWSDLVQILPFFKYAVVTLIICLFDYIKMKFKKDKHKVELQESTY